MTGQSKGVEFWRQHLAKLRFPALSAGEAREQLLNEETSIQQLSGLLAHDPPLALEILLATLRLPGARGRVNSLQHALNLLGRDRVRSLLAALLKNPIDPNNPAHRGFLQTVVVCEMASALIAEWEPAIAQGDDQPLRWMLILLNLARWRLTLAAPELHARINNRVWSGERRKMLEDALLGCRLEDLNARLLTDAGFSPDTDLVRIHSASFGTLARASAYPWTAEIAPEVPAAIGRWLQQPLGSVLLAHLLAWAAHDGWYSRRTQLLLRVVSAQRNERLDVISATVHRVAARCSRSLGFAECVFTPAEQLFWPPPPRRKLAGARRPAAQTQATPAPAAAQSSAAKPTQATASQAAAHSSTPPDGLPDESRLQIYVVHCQEGLHHDVNQLMTETCLTLASAIGLTRSLMLLKPNGSEVLGCFFAHGFGNLVRKRDLQFPLMETNLLTRLVSHPGALWVRSDKISVARAQLPESLVPLVSNRGLMLGSVKLGEISTGVIWADAEGSTTRIVERHYAAFRHVTHHFGLSYTRLAQRIRGKA